MGTAPLVGVAFILLAAWLAAAILLGGGRLPALRHVNTTSVWHVLVWLLLFCYPTVSRQTLETFNCVDFRDAKLLFADPRITCYEDENWRVWAVLSSFGVLLYCIGIPLFLYLAARAYHDAADSRVQRVTLLCESYDQRFWYFESLDMVRKFLQVSAVAVVAPNTKLQLWFGLMIALLGVLVFAVCAPYSDSVCSRAQLAALTSIALTYAAATVFFEEPSSAARQAPLSIGSLDE